MADIDLGTLDLVTIAAQSHDWQDTMDRNFLKMTLGMHPTVDTIVQGTDEPPAGASALNITSGKASIVVGANRYSAAIPQGVLVSVLDRKQMWFKDYYNAWRVALDFNEAVQAMPREFNFHSPGPINRSGTLFQYVPTIEFTVDAGAPGSYAVLGTPSTTPFSLSVTGLSGPLSISFAAGDVWGVFSGSGGTIIPANDEASTHQSPILKITLNSDPTEAENLSIGLAGRVRSLREDAY